MTNKTTNKQIKASLDLAIRMEQERSIRCNSCGKSFGLSEWDLLRDHFSDSHMKDSGQIARWINATSPVYEAPE